VVGAWREDSAATGSGGDQLNNAASNAGAAYVFVRTGTAWSQQAYLKASNTEIKAPDRYGDHFGWSVAVSGDTVVVGAIYEDSAATGINGNQRDNSAVLAGAAYVFVRTGTAWSQQAYLKASNTDAYDAFGAAVDVDGDTVVVSAIAEDSRARGVNGNQADNGIDDAGAAYVFVRTGTTWRQQAYLKAANTQQTVSDTPYPFGYGDLFGSAVAVSGDRIVVGAVFEDGDSAGISDPIDADVIPQSGAVYVFNRHGSVWSHPTMVKASNPSPQGNFGVAVGLSGDMVMASAFCESSGTTGIDGNQRDTSAPGSGAAYIFHIPEYTMHMPRLQVAR
jgi:trimeric autotransporter adhesin